MSAWIQGATGSLLGSWALFVYVEKGDDEMEEEEDLYSPSMPYHRSLDGRIDDVHVFEHVDCKHQEPFCVDITNIIISYHDQSGQSSFHRTLDMYMTSILSVDPGKLPKARTKWKDKSKWIFTFAVIIIITSCTNIDSLE